jgi:prepilin-type N-terminal cleavage/methylation domain-containing protein
MPSYPRIKKKRQAFSLVEVIVVLSIMGFVLAAISSMYIYSLRTSNTTTINLEMSQKLRSLSSTLFSDIESADGFVVYESFQSNRALVPAAAKGNYLVLYYTDNNDLIYKIIGYYLLDNSTDANPVALKRHETTFSTTYADITQAPLPSPATSTGHLTLLDKVVGHYTSPRGNCLFIYQDASKILVSGKYLYAANAQTASLNRPFSFVLNLWSSL